MTSPLPVPLTPILGRESEIHEVCGLLDSDGIRLLTLTGPGGIGKTRLALEIATRLDPEYAHGACFVPLAPVQAPSHVLPTVAQALGIREGGDVPIAELLMSVLRDRHELLVLDNFEHVVDAAVPWLGDLLGACPRLKAMVTSRTPLRVTGERRYLVPPLTLPASGSVETLAGSPAARLFVERAVAIRHDFALDDTNADAVRDICHQLEGIPLAIELAAARVNVLTPQEVVTRLPNRLALLSGGDRDLPARHQTMRGAIEWSYDLLSEPEQSLLQRLAVFTGGFTLEAAETVADATAMDDGGPRAVDLVGSLIDQSLIRHMPGRHGESRLWMLETIRQFGLERLLADGEMSVARDAHAAWYLQMGTEAEEGMQGPDQAEWLDRLDVEYDNLRSVFAWLYEQERVEDAADLAIRLIFFRFICGHNREFRPYLEALLAHPLLTQPTLARGKSLLASGGGILSMGDSEQAMAALYEALAIFRERDERGYAAMALGNMGVALMSRDDLDGAETALEESVSLAREVNLGRFVSAGIGNLGIVAWTQGRMDDAEALIAEGLRFAREDKDLALVAQGVGNLGEMAFNRGDFGRAESLFRESMDLITALGDRRDLPRLSISLAKIARFRGDNAAASAYLETALEVAREIGDLPEVAFSLMALGTLASLRGHHADAVQALRQSITTFQQLGWQFGIAECLDALADTAVRTRDMTAAARLIGAADAALERIGSARFEGLPREEHQERISSARAALGEAAFVAAYDAGRAMTLQQAVSEALAFAPPNAVPDAPLPDEASGLSPRELEVLRLMADGLTNQQIAGALFVSPRTVASHAASILGKLGLSSRTGVVAYAIRNGLA